MFMMKRKSPTIKEEGKEAGSEGMAVGSSFSLAVCVRKRDAHSVTVLPPHSVCVGRERQEVEERGQSIERL